MSPSTPPALLLLVAVLLTNGLAIFLDAATYDDLSSQLGTLPALLLITVRWCDHCAALKPELKALAAAARLSPDVLVARVDADDEPRVSAKLAVRAYPTILYVPRGHNLADGPDGVLEFADYRWAELMAEFVNNETKKEVMAVQLRPAFLKWREKNPYNIGKKELLVEKEEQQQEETGHVLKEMTNIREPVRLVGNTFEETVFKNANMRFMVLFYENDDPFLRDVLIQWRQASSAFTGADNVTIAIVNLSEQGNEQLVERFGIKGTPRCLYFAKCESEDELPACKEPLGCDEDLDETENIIQFLSDRVLEEMGVKRQEVEKVGKSKTYHLSEEQYQKMKMEGTVFANDPDDEESMRSIYEEKTEELKDDFADIRDEL